MRSFNRLASCLAAVLLLAPVAAAAAEPAVGEGVGTYSCAEFTQATRRDPTRLTLYFSWAQGWMTAWNLAQMDAAKPPRIMSSRSMPDQQAFIRTYCSGHPKALYMEAVYHLYASLQVGAVNPRP